MATHDSFFDMYQNFDLQETVEGFASKDVPLAGIQDEEVTKYIWELKNNPQIIFRGNQPESATRQLFKSVCIEIARRVTRSMHWGPHKKIYKTLYPDSSTESSTVDLKSASKSDSILQYGRTPLDADVCGECPLDFKCTKKEAKSWFQKGDSTAKGKQNGHRRYSAAGALLRRMSTQVYRALIQVLPGPFISMLVMIQT